MVWHVRLSPYTMMKVILGLKMLVIWSLLKTIGVHRLIEMFIYVYFGRSKSLLSKGEMRLNHILSAPCKPTCVTELLRLYMEDRWKSILIEEGG